MREIKRMKIIECFVDFAQAFDLARRREHGRYWKIWTNIKR